MLMPIVFIIISKKKMMMLIRLIIMTTIPTILIKFKLKIKPISLNKMMITSLRTIMLIRKTATVAKSITTLIGKIAVTKTT